MLTIFAKSIMTATRSSGDSPRSNTPEDRKPRLSAPAHAPAAPLVK